MELEYLTSLGFSIIATEPILLHHPEDPPPEPAEASLAFAEAMAEDRGGRADTPPVPPKVHRRGAEDGGDFRESRGFSVQRSTDPILLRRQEDLEDAKQKLEDVQISCCHLV
ncbi:unnamed protein product [Durusdinium trenchii]|uniref:Uncharacterized protein n=1 Tax=Durusdinium trenchii TaxID=1381693 RepID=A0ABP0HXI8_9DINO